jgi:hypothetical protein
LIDAALGAFENVETALYFSGVAFTSLGYATSYCLGLRLAAPLQAANGLMIFGIPTASFITGVQHAIKK